jgi:1-acyl-sn-glycerol-3-phosphate acyltransferase
MISVFRFLISSYFNIFYKVYLHGMENIPKDGGVLLCSNHVGESDMLLIGYKSKRLVRWMAKEELFKIPFARSLFKYLGAYPIKRGAGDIAAIKVSLGLLKNGEILGIFPEGTRTRNKKKVKAKPGAAMLALKAKVPILPVAIKRQGGFFSRIDVIFGECYYLDERKFENDKTLTKSEILSLLSQDIMDKIYNMMEECV